MDAAIGPLSCVPEFTDPSSHIGIKFFSLSRTHCSSRQKEIEIISGLYHERVKIRVLRGGVGNYDLLVPQYLSQCII